ncbi:MAG: TolC family protein, partial [Myxococcales bacterium]|nr:TolC family protein [Myxococcales bacterium]
MRPAPPLAALFVFLASTTLVPLAAADPPAATVSIPAPPEVNDPLLAPVPPPRRVLRSWDEAVALLRSRSTDLRIAVDDLRRAEAQTRKALAAYLPTITGKLAYNRQVLTRPGTVAVYQNTLVTTSEVPVP